ncbi:hypothetical protein [uncultured Selenomonas sp.]|uniref:hypothetical protein n=1 Tax=uncultured Selenomonas sp. TaxID=159275 RepID=UPI0028D6D1E8|nr:hypothetical protein [uncultured Selenomonas sp.]
MTDKEWMQLELNRMVKAEGGKVSVERMTEIVSELSRRLRENPNLPREVNTLTADELIARARTKTGEERYRIIQRVLRIEPENITAACMQVEYLAKNADDRVHHYEDLTRQATARLEAEGVFCPENIGRFWAMPSTKPYMFLRLSYLESLLAARKLRLAAKECAEMLRLSSHDALGRRYQLMFIYASIEEGDAAIELYQRYEEGVALMYLPLAMLFYRLGKMKMARNFLQELAAVNTETEAFFARGVAGDLPRRAPGRHAGSFAIGTMEEFGEAVSDNEFAFIGMDAFFAWGLSELRGAEVTV